MRFSVIVGYRNRDLERVKHSLDSLAHQTHKEFELLFVDYGSDLPISIEIEKLLKRYAFAKYIFSDTRGWFWNRAHALNTGVRFATGNVLLFFDIDIILEPEFLTKLTLLDFKKQFYTFNCFYLPKGLFPEIQSTLTTSVKFDEAYVGLCAVKKEYCELVRGFDEYYMVWGAEDDDLIIRLSQIELERKHISQRHTPIYHQWHPTQAPFKPTPWYLLIVNYLYSERQSPILNNEWGKHFSINDRPVLKYLDDKSYNKKVKLNCWADQTLMFFNPIVAGFHKLASGEIAYFDYTYIPPKLSKNRLLPFFTKNKTVVEKISRKDVTHFFQFFIGSNRELMQDYYYEEKEDRLLFVCIKK